MSIKPLTVEELFASHREFIGKYVNSEATQDLRANAPELKTQLGALVVFDFLRPSAEQALDELVFDAEGYCRIATQNRVADGLLRFMGGISRLYVSRHPLLEFKWSVKRLEDSATNPKLLTAMEMHHDWKDGNSVLYNRRVRGKQIYTAGEKKIEIVNNQLVILNGDSTFLPSKQAYGTVAHGVEVEKLSEEGVVGRERYLAFYDGRPTDTTQLPPEA